MTKLVTLIFFLFVSSVVLAAKPSQTKPKEELTPPNSQFELEKGLVESIYQASVSESVEIRPVSAGISVSPQISYVNPTRLSLLNSYWEVPYTDQIGALPLLSLHIANSVLHWSGLSLAIKGSVGYSYKENVLTAISRQTGKESRAVLTLHWLPISLGTRLEYHISGFHAVKPYLNLEGGAQWLYQSGKLDGIEQGFWVPFYQVSFGLTLFGPTRTQGEWFGGINVGSSIRNSLASQLDIQSWSMDVGVNFYL